MGSMLKLNKDKRETGTAGGGKRVTNWKYISCRAFVFQTPSHHRSSGGLRYAANGVSWLTHIIQWTWSARRRKELWAKRRRTECIDLFNSLSATREESGHDSLL